MQVIGMAIQRGNSACILEHTAGLDTIFVQIYMDPPPGVPGVSKDAPGSTKHAI